MNAHDFESNRTTLAVTPDNQLDPIITIGEAAALPGYPTPHCGNTKPRD